MTLTRVAFYVSIERQNAAGEPVTIVDATGPLAGASLRYVPVVRDAAGSVVLRLVGSSDLATALLEARVFAAQHELPFRDVVLP